MRVKIDLKMCFENKEVIGKFKYALNYPPVFGFVWVLNILKLFRFNGLKLLIRLTTFYDTASIPFNIPLSFLTSFNDTLLFPSGREGRNGDFGDDLGSTKVFLSIGLFLQKMSQCELN